SCTYPRITAFALGLTAFLLLVAFHAIINASCCNKLSMLPLGFYYYLTISSIKDTNQMGTPVSADNHGNTMTQPQVPAQMTLQPVFVP
ncbi:hypothetical protein MKX01_039710, partial [Papaver californicum]